MQVTCLFYCAAFVDLNARICCLRFLTGPPRPTQNARFVVGCDLPAASGFGLVFCLFLDGFRAACGPGLGSVSGRCETGCEPSQWTVSDEVVMTPGGPPGGRPPPVSVWVHFPRRRSRVLGPSLRIDSFFVCGLWEGGFPGVLRGSPEGPLLFNFLGGTLNRVLHFALVAEQQEGTK